MNERQKTRRLHWTAACAASGCILLNVASVQASTWTGAVSDAFDVAGNWTPSIPDSSNIADLGAGVAIYSGTTISEMTVQGLKASSGSFTQAGGTLNIASANWDDNFGTSDSASFTMTAGTINLSGNILRIGSGAASTTFSMSGSSILNSTANYLVFGNGSSVTGTMSEDSKITVSNRLYIGDSGSSGSASITMSDNSTIESSAGEFYIGNGAASGSLTLEDSASVSVTSGSLNLGRSGGTASLWLKGNSSFVSTSSSDIALAQSGSSNASITLEGYSSFTASSAKIKMGDNTTDSTSQAIITLNEHSAMTVNRLTIGHIGGDGAKAEVNVNDEATLTVNDHITMGRDDGGGFGIDSVLNINGGTVATKYIENGGSGGSGDHVVNIDGGTILALADSANFFSTGSNNTVSAIVNLLAAGLTFDTNGYDVGIGTSLDGEGSLTKTGLGTLTLSVASAYDGGTMIEEGTLSLDSIYLSDAATVTIGADGILNLNFTGTDVIGGLVVDGVVYGNGVYGAGDLGSFLTGTGTLTVVPEPATVGMAIVGGLILLAFARRIQVRRA